MYKVFFLILGFKGPIKKTQKKKKQKPENSVLGNCGRREINVLRKKS